MTPRRFYLLLGLIVLLGFAVRMAYLLAVKWDQPLWGDAFTYHWTATALDESGVATGTALDLGTTATVGWTPYNNYGFFFGSGACQAGNGQRVRVTLAVTDSAGQTGTTLQEVRVVCPPV